MSKRANRKSAPTGRKGRIQVYAEGAYRNTSTWPYGKIDLKTGTQSLIKGVRVNW